MSYEFNPLLPDGFQKKSAVTPADISRVESEISDLQSTTTDLKQKKVTKFFSANDFYYLCKLKLVLIDYTRCV